MLLLGKDKLNLNTSDLPCLIHGETGSGASLFSIALLAEQFYLQGAKILFFSAQSMAREEFFKQTNQKELENNQAVFIKSGDQESFIHTIETLSDIDERVIFVKNIEDYDERVWQSIQDKHKLIVSGNLEQASVQDKLLQKNWATKIFFSLPSMSLGIQLPSLEKYQGYLIGSNKTGIVTYH